MNSSDSVFTIVPAASVFVYSSS